MAADTSRRSTMDFYQWYAGVSGTWVNCRPVRSAGTPVPSTTTGSMPTNTTPSPKPATSSAPAGNSSGGVRDVTAAYIESLVPITEQIELNLAGRFDKYSDFGSAFSPRRACVTSRWTT